MHKEAGINPSVIRAGKANMFLSPVFCEALSCLIRQPVELYDTDGSLGAAGAAGVGSGYYKNFKEAFKSLKRLKVIEPDLLKSEQYQRAYLKWYDRLKMVKK